MSTASVPAPATWPSPDFLSAASRLRAELEVAIRVEHELAQKVSAIEDAAFRKGVPVAAVAGGDSLAKFSADQANAALAASSKREELRQYLNAERARFFALRNREYDRLRPGISEQFTRMQRAAAEFSAAISDLLGAGAEASREETLIRQWNRAARKFNQTIPGVNVNGIPSAGGIELGESLRSFVEGLLLQDRNIREMCREILSREAKQRALAAEQEELRITEAERAQNPVLFAKPF